MKDEGVHKMINKAKLRALPAGGIEGALKRLFRFHGVDKRPTFVVDPVVQNLLDVLSPQRRVVIKIANDLPAQCPEIVDVLLNHLRDRSEAANACKKGRKEATSFSPGGNLFSSPIHERGQLLRSRQ